MRVIDGGGHSTTFGCNRGTGVAVEHVMLQAHVVSQLMGETQITGGAIAVDDVKPLARKIGVFVEHQVRQPASAGVISPQAHNISAVQVAKLVDGIHEAVGGALQACKVGGEIALCIVDLTGVNQSHTLFHEAIGVRVIGFRHGQVHE